MRVDLTAYGPQPPDNSKASRSGQSPATPTATSSTPAVDQTRFSFDQARVQSLEAQVMAQPEMREQKVASLQKLLASGSYRVSDAQIAQAMFAEWAGSNSGQ
jgi:flagellar biosynthesis anti-sigma factor FlgM